MSRLARNPSVLDWNSPLTKIALAVAEDYPLPAGAPLPSYALAHYFRVCRMRFDAAGIPATDILQWAHEQIRVLAEDSGRLMVAGASQTDDPEAEALAAAMNAAPASLKQKHVDLRCLLHGLGIEEAYMNGQPVEWKVLAEPLPLDQLDLLLHSWGQQLRPQ